MYGLSYNLVCTMQNTIASNGWEACSAGNRVSKDSHDLNLVNALLLPHFLEINLT